MNADTNTTQRASAAVLDAESLTLLAASVERYGRDKYSFEARKALLGRAPGFSLAAWQDYADMGWLAAHLPLDAGGFGGDARAIAALMRFAGEHLALEPLFASVVLAGGVLAACEGAAARSRLEALAGGSRIFALAHAEGLGDGMDGSVDAVVRAGCLSGSKRMVLHGDVADELIVSARGDGGGSAALYALDTSLAGVRRSAMRLLDGRGAASFVFDAVPVTQLVSAAPDGWLDHARLALCAEAHGAMRALNRDTLAYLKTRRQFGRPIGANQALQHRMTELYMLEQETAAVIDAAQRACVSAADESGVRSRRAVSGAAAHCIHAGRQIAHEAVQLHGGIGTTDELAVSHYFKRIMVLNRLLGDRDAHLDAFAAADAACAPDHATGAASPVTPRT